jgi:type IV pilus assembly protein PilV
MKSFRSLSSLANGTRHIAGFTLVETLVAVLVLSIGLLGVASLQLSSLRSNATATQRSQATFLVYDITDRMRANRDAAIDGAYEVSFDEFAAIPVGGAPTGDVAEDDLSDWKERLLATLPASAASSEPPDAEISMAGPPEARVFTVSIRWDDTRGVDNPSAGDQRVRFDMQTRLF